MKTIFDSQAKQELVNRIGQLNENSAPEWGKMRVGQMLWHCQFPLLIAIKNENKGNGQFLMKLFKRQLYSQKPFRKNLPTAKDLVPLVDNDFTTEKQKILELIDQTHDLKSRETWQPHPLFGEFTHEQWGILEYKHLDHHLTQFGV